MGAGSNSLLTPGFRLDRYELLAPISRGGMASVWLARLSGKHGFQKLVAIKTILPEHAEDKRFRDMFLDEARIASRIEHENVVHVLDIGEEANVLYLAMDFIDGDSLTRYRRPAESDGEHFPLAMCLHVAMEACAGLHAAHELRDADGSLLGVVHRDVSPQNIIVGPRGVAKVIDFGIAKAKNRLAGDTTGDVVKGKLKFMAPEQMMGRTIDRRADVWAIGAVLYDLIAGAPPYEAENEAMTLFKIVSGEAPPPLPPEVPNEVGDVILKALAHEAANRYATAEEMRAALEHAARGANLVTTSAAIAAFGEQHLKERNERRRETIRLGLEAARARAEVESKLRPMVDSVSGSGSSGAGDTVEAPTTAIALDTSSGLVAPPPPKKRLRFVAFGLGAVVVASASVFAATRTKPAPASAATEPVASVTADAGADPPASASAVVNVPAPSSTTPATASTPTARPPKRPPPKPIASTFVPATRF